MSAMERKHGGGTLILSDTKDSSLSSAGPGEFEGRASAFNSIDSYGDTVVPGAYKDTIPDFLKRGFISWSHDWSSPVGMPIAAEERSDGLWITGRWHSDPTAQMYRSRVLERAKAGLSTGLSIGYEVKQWSPGTQTGVMRVLEKINLFEVAVVTVPADSRAGIGAARTAQPVKHWDPALQDSLDRFKRLMRIYGNLR